MDCEQSNRKCETVPILLSEGDEQYDHKCEKNEHSEMISEDDERSERKEQCEMVTEDNERCEIVMKDYVQRNLKNEFNGRQGVPSWNALRRMRRRLQDIQRDKRIPTRTKQCAKYIGGSTGGVDVRKTESQIEH